MTKALNLTLKKKWFDLVASGEKIREYRQRKPYWEKRFLDKNGFAIKFDEVHFKNGYGKNVPFLRVEWKTLAIIYGGDWPCEHGEIARDGDFVIHLGKILELRV